MPSDRWNAQRDYYNNVRVLITGSSGFLGQRLAWVLSSLGARVFGLDYNEDQYNLEAFTLGDVRDYATIERVVADVKPIVVFHLAAISQVVDAELIPRQTFETNIMGTVNVLEVFRHILQGAAIVVASSDKAYGKPTVVPASERTHLDPYHPYDVSKASADFVARCYSETYGVSVATTRCGNIFGPGDTNWQRIIPDTIRAILEERPLIIRSDGTHRREYNYVDDIIEAYLMVANDLTKNGATGIPWTISDPNAVYTTIEIAESVAVVMGKPLETKILGGAQKEEQEISLNSSLIRERLGWKPKTPTSAGLRETVKWIRKYLYD